MRMRVEKEAPSSEEGTDQRKLIGRVIFKATRLLSPDYENTKKEISQILNELDRANYASMRTLLDSHELNSDFVIEALSSLKEDLDKRHREKSARLMKMIDDDHHHISNYLDLIEKLIKETGGNKDLIKEKEELKKKLEAFNGGKRKGVTALHTRWIKTVVENSLDKTNKELLSLIIDEVTKGEESIDCPFDYETSNSTLVRKDNGKTVIDKTLFNLFANWRNEKGNSKQNRKNKS